MHRYTAQMGHSSESAAMVDSVLAAVGPRADRDEVRQNLLKAAREIELLAGRSFSFRGQTTLEFDSGGLPFVDVPDLNMGTLEGPDGVEAVPDPRGGDKVTVMQLTPLARTAPTAVPIGQALWVAGQVASKVAADGLLSREFVVAWLGSTFDREARDQLLRRLADQSVRFHVPITAGEIGGWWVQIARRIAWVTTDTEDEGRLLQPLLDLPEDRRAMILCAYEPVMIIARLTAQPSDMAISVRIWPEGSPLDAARPWHPLAAAIREYGIPVLTIDPASTPAETACQLLLLGYWHGYVGRDETALADGVAAAFPRQVDRVRRGTSQPNARSAAALLLEGLLFPGFDPARGAESNRRYVSRKASITVMEHRKAEHPERYPWTALGIIERRYYKLARGLGVKTGGRYQDPDALAARVGARLDERTRKATVKRLALEVLTSRGFSEAAARKWLQRHAPEAAAQAMPRRGHDRGGDPSR